MLPVIFRIFHFPVSGYLFFYVLGIVVGTTLILLLSRKEKLDLIETAAFLVLGIACGLLGARLLPALLDLLFRQEGQVDGTGLLRRQWASGGSFFGAVLASLLFAILYSRAFFKGCYRRLWDITVIGIALGHAIGRLGCFAAGCCYGIPTRLPWGVSFATLGRAPHPLAGIPLHPVQLYEAGLCLANAAFLFRLWRKRRFPGQVFSFYMVNYGLIRFSLEFLRHHEAGEMAWPGGLSWYQALSLAMLLAGWFFHRRFRRGQAGPAY